MTINELARIMGKNRNEVETMLKATDVIELDLTRLDGKKVL